MCLLEGVLSFLIVCALYVFLCELVCAILRFIVIFLFVVIGSFWEIFRSFNISIYKVNKMYKETVCVGTCKHKNE